MASTSSTAPSGAQFENTGGSASGGVWSELETRLGVRFLDPQFLRTALTHPSYANEHPEESPETNERLEFLGDAVLGLIVAETLYARYPDVEEGRLTEWRAQLVCGPTLSKVASGLDLGRELMLGRGEETTGGRKREGNLERAFEAVVGAVMLDQGLEAARAFSLGALATEMAALDDDSSTLNPKGALQQLVQGRFGRPHYVTTHEEGPEHARTFTIEVRLDGEAVGTGTGTSKQTAEKAAAREAIAAIRARLDAEQTANNDSTDSNNTDRAGA